MKEYCVLELAIFLSSEKVKKYYFSCQSLCAQIKQSSHSLATYQSISNFNKKTEPGITQARFFHFAKAKNNPIATPT